MRSIGIPRGLVLAAALLSIPVAAEAHFERTVASTRSVSLGGAFVGIADDASTVYLNPAGMAGLDRIGFLTTYQKPYGLGDLDEAFAACALPTRYGAVGLSWHHFGLRDALSEDLITLSGARDLIRTSQEASLSIGANVDLARVSAVGEGKSGNVVTWGVSVLLRPFPSIGVGYVGRNLTEGEFDLAEGGTVTRLERTHAWGISFEWHNAVTFALARKRNLAGQWRNHTGVEVMVSPELVLRSGLDNSEATGGFGVRWKDVAVDVGIAGHEALGATYIVSIGYRLPRKAEQTSAQNR